MAEKYVVIANKLEIELKKMRAEGNMKLPSEQSLALQNSCSRQTVRAALDLLQKAGLIEKRTGSGSYIVEESKKNKTVFLITEDCDRYLSPALISGLRSELASSKYVLKAFSTMGSSKEEAKVISRAISEKAAALIIEPVRDLIPNANDSLIEEAMSLHIPVIYLNSSEGKQERSLQITSKISAGTISHASSALTHLQAWMNTRVISEQFRILTRAGVS